MRGHCPPVQVCKLKGHKHKVRKMLFSPDQDYVISCGDNTVRFWKFVGWTHVSICVWVVFLNQFAFMPRKGRAHQPFSQNKVLHSRPHADVRV